MERNAVFGVENTGISLGWSIQDLSWIPVTTKGFV
jgi:hypothetical protein